VLVAAAIAGPAGGPAMAAGDVAAPAPPSAAPACAGDPTRRPATLLAGSAAQASLARAVAQLLGAAPPALAPDALVGSDALVVERTASGVAASDGRGTGIARPEVFHLVVVDRECFLVHDTDDRAARLDGDGCVPRGGAGR